MLLKAVGRLTSVVVMEVEPMNQMELGFFFTHILYNMMMKENEGLTA